MDFPSCQYCENTNYEGEIETVSPEVKGIK